MKQELSPNERRLKTLGTLFDMRQYIHGQLAREEVQGGTRFRMHAQLEAVQHAIACVEKMHPPLSDAEIKGAF